MLTLEPQEGLLVSSECIHGLDGIQCAVCFPKAEPEPVASSVGRASSGTATGRATRTVRKRVPGASVPKASAPKRLVDVGEQRLYHLTHISNIPSILASGTIVADALQAAEERPRVDISAVGTRESRRSAHISGYSDLTVADFVPFFLSPDANLWNHIRSGADDNRLSDEIRSSSSYDFVILVSTLKAIRALEHESDEQANRILADGDAAGSLTRFTSSPESSDRMLRALRADEESDAITHCEFLVRERVPFEAVTLIGVVNDTVRGKLKEALSGTRHAPKVSIYPPWFKASE